MCYLQFVSSSGNVFSSILKTPNGKRVSDLVNEEDARHFPKIFLISENFNHLRLYLSVCRSIEGMWYFELRSLIDVSTLDEEIFYTIEICRTSEKYYREKKSVSWQYSDEIVANDRPVYHENIGVSENHLMLVDEQILLCRHKHYNRMIVRYNITVISK